VYNQLVGKLGTYLSNHRSTMEMNYQNKSTSRAVKNKEQNETGIDGVHNELVMHDGISIKKQNNKKADVLNHIWNKENLSK
jgi:hypothetical protein